VNEDEISAYHEAGHIITNTTIGRRVKRSEIYPRSFTDFFQADEPITLPRNTLVGVVFDLPIRSNESPISWEEATLKAHSDHPLEKYLLTLVAGVEASLIYAEAKGWDTAPINAEAEDPETYDAKVMKILIKGQNRQDEEQELRQNARRSARTLLQETHIWISVCSFALLLIDKQKIQWYTLPENYKQIINKLIARGKKNSQTQFP